MTDTVTRLMALVDSAIAAAGKHKPSSSVDYRAAIEAELTRLFTPLSADEKLRIALDCNMRVRTGLGAYKYATAIEAAHGIGGES